MLSTVKTRTSQVLIAVILGLFCSFMLKSDCFAKEYVVVLDAGHGGEDEGGRYNGIDEKDMNLIVAQEMKTTLDKYDNIRVLMTREGDDTVKIPARFEFAHKNQADLFIALHFNLSESRKLYGSEVWISAFGDCYKAAYPLAELVLNNYDRLGIYRRGIKTKLNKDGLDYYGVIRGCTSYGIPSCIFEHCHFDNEEDKGNYESEELLRQFGRLDGEAVAEYFGLRLKDSSNPAKTPRFTDAINDTKTLIRAHDKTRPEVASIELVSVDDDYMLVSVTGQDSESGLLYYDYSTDGGNTFSSFLKWASEGDDGLSPKSRMSEKEQLREDTILVKIPFDEHVGDSLVCRVYNAYDLETVTNSISLEVLQDRISDIQQSGQGDTSGSDLSNREALNPEALNQEALNREVSGAPDTDYEELAPPIQLEDDRIYLSKDERVNKLLIFSLILLGSLAASLFTVLITRVVVKKISG